MKILLHGLNYAPEEIGIGKYSGEMVAELADVGCEVSVVTTPPYYPQWKISNGFRGIWYSHETETCEHGAISVVRCPLWVPKRVNGLKRIVHLASFGLSSVPVVFWKALTQRPDVIITVEPAAFCLPTTWLAARLCGAKAWLHVQDFEVDAAFELGILKQPLLKKFISAVEAFLMRRFDRVSSVSPNMVKRLQQKSVPADRCRLFPNWVDCEAMRPLPDAVRNRERFGIPTDKCVAMYAGNIGAKQGIEIIIDAAKMASNASDLHFVICGTGAAFPALKGAATGLPNVQLMPPQPYEQFNELMNCADIHLLPQLAGAADLVMPSKLTGMLATGRAVVACADAGTQIAAAVDGHGLTVPPGDAASFYDAIATLAHDPERRQQFGNAGRSHAVEYLDKSVILQHFFHEMSDLCGITAVTVGSERRAEVASETIPFRHAPHLGSKTQLKTLNSNEPNAR